MKEIVFNSEEEAVQYLSDFTNKKIIISANYVKPKVKDFAVIHHPKGKKFYVFILNNENIKPGAYFNENDLVANGEYDESIDLNKIDLDLDKKRGLHAVINSVLSGKINKENIENMPKILFGDYVKSDKELEPGNLSFETGRKYTEILPIKKRLERIKKNPNRAKKHIQKQKEEVNPEDILKNVFDKEVVFASYYSNQINPIIEESEKSESNPKIKVVFDNLKTNWFDVSTSQLKNILDVLERKE